MKRTSHYKMGLLAALAFVMMGCSITMHTVDDEQLGEQERAEEGAWDQAHGGQPITCSSDYVRPMLDAVGAVALVGITGAHAATGGTFMIVDGIVGAGLGLSSWNGFLVRSECEQYHETQGEHE